MKKRSVLLISCIFVAALLSIGSSRLARQHRNEGHRVTGVAVKTRRGFRDRTYMSLSGHPVWGVRSAFAERYTYRLVKVERSQIVTMRRRYPRENYKVVFPSYVLTE